MKKPKSNAPYVFDVYLDAFGQWRWRLWAKNGKVVADSGEAYERRGHCVRMCNRLTYGLFGAQVFVEGVAL